MHLKVAMTIVALSVGGALILSSPPLSAQQGQHQENKKEQGKSRGGGGGERARSRQKTHTAKPHSNRRTITRRKTDATPRARTRSKVHTETRRRETPKATRKITSQDGGKRISKAGKLRGAAHARIRGRNFSVWRGRHRIRHGNGFRTFVTLSTLGAILYGSDYYYPYAYLSASEPYCDGVTDDGCVLRWREVETIEGNSLYQCVAYCPWQ